MLWSISVMLSLAIFIVFSEGIFKLISSLQSMVTSYLLPLTSKFLPHILFTLVYSGLLWLGLFQIYEWLQVNIYFLLKNSLLFVSWRQVGSQTLFQWLLCSSIGTFHLSDMWVNQMTWPWQTAESEILAFICLNVGF